MMAATRTRWKGEAGPSSGLSSPNCFSTSLSPVIPKHVGRDRPEGQKRQSREQRQGGPCRASSYPCFSKMVKMTTDV